MNDPAGQHDDLGMSPAMLAWAAQHVHLNGWQQPIFLGQRPMGLRSPNSLESGKAAEPRAHALEPARTDGALLRSRKRAIRNEL
jgi:hypothetical protein